MLRSWGCASSNHADPYVIGFSATWRQLAPGPTQWPVRPTHLQRRAHVRGDLDSFFFPFSPLVIYVLPPKPPPGTCRDR